MVWNCTSSMLALLQVTLIQKRTSTAMSRKTCFKGPSLLANHRANQGFEQSRRDDLEAIGNMLMYLQCRQLPMKFQCMDINPEADKLASQDMWLSQLPSAFMPYLKYALRRNYYIVWPGSCCVQPSSRQTSSRLSLTEQFTP